MAIEIDLPLYALTAGILCVVNNCTTNPVYVLAPEGKVISVTIITVPVAVLVKPNAKLNVLNQLVAVNVNADAPVVIDKFGALVIEPPVVPNVNVLVTVPLLTNPPVPVYVKLVTSAIDNTVWAADVCVSEILLVPKLMARTLAPVEANIPVVKSNPFKVNVPAVNVYVPVAVNAYALPNDTVPAVCVNVPTGDNVPPL